MKRKKKKRKQIINLDYNKNQKALLTQRISDSSYSFWERNKTKPRCHKKDKEI